MSRLFLFFLCVYFAFAWQATLRPEIGWNGFMPNFLALVLIGSCIVLNDVTALFVAALLGFLSDSLAPRGLGPDVLSYIILTIALQAICPPKLVRNPAVLLLVLLLSTCTLEFSGTVLRMTLNHDLVWSDPQLHSILGGWGVTAAGNGVYTALLAVVPLIAIRSATTRVLHESKDTFSNRWHRLTSI